MRRFHNPFPTLRKWVEGVAKPSFLLAEAAQSECAPSMRAVKDSSAIPS